MKNKLTLICGIITAMLLITGFLLPPLGIIDNSVLIASGIITAYPTLWSLKDFIGNGKLKITKGDTSVDIDPE